MRYLQSSQLVWTLLLVALTACESLPWVASREPISIPAGTTLPSPALHGIYLTWDSPDTARTMVVNAISREPLNNIELRLTESSESKPLQKAQNSKAPQPATLVKPDVRNVKGAAVQIYSFRLQNLKPATRYDFSISGDQLAPTAPRTFLTLPADARPIEVIQGGDLSVNKDIVTVAQKTVTEKTMAFLVGGDLAYDNGDVTKLELWMDLLQLLERAALSPDKRMIPLIMGIGNHEVNRKQSIDPLERSPFYLLFFRQNELKTYFRRDLGASAVLFNLDSGHLTKHGGAQRDWLEAELKNSPSTSHRLAMYHVPLYPSIRAYKEAYSALGRQEWLPLFDRYQLTLSFENHDHAMKRTHMLKEGKVVTSRGTVYVGDGCWGVGPRYSQKAWYIKNIQAKKHLWRVQITPRAVTATAVGLSGEILDSFKIEDAKVSEQSF